MRSYGIPRSLKRTCKLFFSVRPILVGSEITFIFRLAADGKLEFYILKTVGLKNLDRKIQAIGDFDLDLVGPRMNRCASSTENPRTRIKPCSVPESSAR